ncbi:unnamed protein product, partial [Parascedosporium putredinis]
LEDIAESTQAPSGSKPTPASLAAPGSSGTNTEATAPSPFLLLLRSPSLS